MRDVTIRSRTDGIVEVSPKLAPLDRGSRILVIATVLLVAGALFVAAVIPAAVAAALAASCLAGEAVLGVKALVLRRRPAAHVVEVAGYARRRRAGGHR